MVDVLQDTYKKIQILAPSGSIDQLVAAVNNGCDAVYLGLDSFNARMKAPNFTLDNLAEWVDYCHLFGVKVYVAINTSLKNDEFLKAVELLYGAYKRNVDGVIVADISLMKIAGALPKPFDVVASTQLNVHDRYGARFVKKCGATTVVCARECSLDDIREIAKEDIGVECFLHGAMCVCQSGQCLFSSMVGGNSGNRGLCAQPCRKFYFADDAGTSGYLLSARDMCGLDTARKLAEAGATTFKIEGRNRRPEYAGMTSRIYLQLFDNDCEAKSDDFVNLAEMFNRSMSANNYLNGGNSDIIYSATQNHIGVAVGVIKRGSIVTDTELCKGDGFKVFDGDKEICGGIALESGTGVVRAQFSGNVADGMTVRRTTSVELCRNVLSTRRKLNVNLEFVAKIGESPRITAICCEAESSIVGDFVVEKAKNTPTSGDEIVKQLQKSGETHYTICDIVIKIDDIFIAKSQINALRRAVLNTLTEKLIDKYNEQFVNRAYVEYSYDTVNKHNDKTVNPVCFAVCYDEQQLQQASVKCDGLIYKPNALNLQSFEVASKYAAYVDLPSFASLEYIGNLLNKVRVKLVCNNVGQVEFARTFNVDYIVGGGLNIFNDRMVSFFSDAKSFMYSRELTLREINEFCDKHGLIFVDGLIPLMQLSHCPYKVAYRCDCSACKADKQLVYRDEMGNRFLIRRRQAERCLFELFNGNKLSVVNKLRAKGRYIVDFDDAVVDHYVSINNGIDDGYTESRPYTKGRLYDKIN